mmetsp:Transcript_87878/g.243791  ORF Transcript_87878/g.243791 Transcript_87878/m.243791 type:complete len:116 (+) Transcript_87878:1195-1542(+)
MANSAACDRPSPGQEACSSGAIANISRGSGSNAACASAGAGGVAFGGPPLVEAAIAASMALPTAAAMQWQQRGRCLRWRRRYSLQLGLITKRKVVRDRGYFFLVQRSRAGQGPSL